MSSPWQVHQPGTLPQTNGSRLHLSHLESKVEVSTPGTKRPLMCSFSSPKPGVLEVSYSEHLSCNWSRNSAFSQQHWLVIRCVRESWINENEKSLYVKNSLWTNSSSKKTWSWKVQLPSWRGSLPVIFSLNSSSLHSSMHPSLMAAHELPPASRGLRFTFKAPCQSQSHPKIHISVLLRVDTYIMFGFSPIPLALAVLAGAYPEVDSENVFKNIIT